MAELNGITSYPLTGARGQECDHTDVWPSGLAGDRMFVLYDPETHDRVSQRQVPKLARLNLLYGSRKLIIRDEVENVVVSDSEVGIVGSQVMVNEFGDDEPCLEVVPDSVHQSLSQYLGKSVRLAQKQLDFREGLEVTKGFYRERIQPAERKNAPLHIINRASVEELDVPGLDVDTLAKRFRANLMVSGFEAFSEAEWLGKCLQIANITIVITRFAVRCPVPGYDQETGENRKDVPKIYRSFPKAESGKPSVGVYGFPVISEGWLSGTVRVGDTVELE